MLKKELQPDLIRVHPRSSVVLSSIWMVFLLSLGTLRGFRGLALLEQTFELIEIGKGEHS